MPTVRLLHSVALTIAACTLFGCASIPSFDSELAACSSHITPGGNVVSVRMHNAGPHPIDIYWVSPGSGKLVHYEQLAARSEHEQETYVGHLWVALRHKRAVGAAVCVMPGTDRIQFGTGAAKVAT